MGSPAIAMTRVSLVCFGLLTVLGLGHGLRGLHRQKLRLEQSLFKEKTSDYPEMWHSQILDHFDATNPEQWNQRYWANFDTYAGEGLAFLFIGGEGEASPGWLNYGMWYEWAQQHGAAMFVLEHRFYGQSHPRPDMSRGNIEYLSSRQGLEDAGNFISSMNAANNLTTWITFGGSYPGSLSGWMRLRFPHLVAGSVSSSGPLFAKLDYYEYLQVVMDALDWTEIPGCNNAWTEALTTVEEMVKSEENWEGLTEKFKLCSILEEVTEVNWGEDVSFVWRPWLWQTCTEFGWYQTTNQAEQKYGSSLPLEFFEQWCSDAFGSDITHEMLERSIAQTNVEYGGFSPAATNVVWVHGSVDPWHAMGVLDTLNEAAPAIYITGTSHCADMYPDGPNDPQELLDAKKRIGELVAQWVQA